MYHVRAVTQTDVVRAGTKEVAKIFQILYDVNAVSGPGSYACLGITTEAKKSNPALYSTVIENPLSMSSVTLSTTTLHNADNLSDSAMGSSTIRSSNGGLLDDYSGRHNYDAISVGSNDSGDVNPFSFLIKITCYDQIT